MPERAETIATFLARHGWRTEDLRPLADDASFRRYLRLADGHRRAVLMDAPPDREDVRPFVRVARHLRALGLSAPEILAEDPEGGLLLLEDLGDGTFTRLLAAGADEAGLYALAVDVLAHLHRLPQAATVPAGLPPYDDGRLLEEALLLTDWYMPAVLDAPCPRAAREGYVAAWSAVLPVVQRGPRTLVLRDFHVDNLMFLEGRAGIAACGLLDFQDAVAGHPAYDLMSLLEDARRDLDTGLKTAMLARYHAALQTRDVDGFRSAFAILAAQRHAKVIGIFTRLCRRDGKPGYLAHIPRVWRLLESALDHPALDPVRAWFQCHLPPDTRRVPTERRAAE